MVVEVLFFGATADITGRRRIEVAVPPETLATSIFKQLISQYSQLAKHRLLFSVNQQYATGEEIIRDGDEIAIFTAVSGG